MKSLFPLFIVDDLARSKRFYVEHFDFTVLFEAEWYVHLIGSSPLVQLAFIAPDHETVPQPFRHQRAAGALVSLEVDDAAAFERRARMAELQIVYPLKDERWGQRHFMTVDPNGLVVDVIESIPKDESWFREQAKV